MAIDPNPLDPENKYFRKCLKGHTSYAVSFPECPSCKIERERSATSKERLPFRWERDTHSGKWRLTTYDLGNDLVAGYDHTAGYYESHLIDEIERLNARLDRQVEIAHDLDRQIMTGLVDRQRLRAALDRIVTNTVHDPATVARNALAGVSLESPTYCDHGFYLGNCRSTGCTHNLGLQRTVLKPYTYEDHVRATIRETEGEAARLIRGVHETAP